LLKFPLIRFLFQHLLYQLYLDNDRPTWNASFAAALSPFERRQRERNQQQRKRKSSTGSSSVSTGNRTDYGADRCRNRNGTRNHHQRFGNPVHLGKLAGKLSPGNKKIFFLFRWLKMLNQNIVMLNKKGRMSKM